MKRISILFLAAAVSSSCVDKKVGKTTVLPDIYSNEVAICEKHHVKMAVYKGYQYSALITGSPWYEAAVVDSPNIIGPNFSYTKFKKFSIPAKSYQCPKCHEEYLEVKDQMMSDIKLKTTSKMLHVNP